MVELLIEITHPGDALSLRQSSHLLFGLLFAMLLVCNRDKTDDEYACERETGKHELLLPTATNEIYTKHVIFHYFDRNHR